MQHDSNEPVVTLANAFTVLRVPLGMVGIVIFAASSQLVGAIVIMVAAATDFLDGIVARKLNQVTKLGAELDPIADKAFLFLVLLYALFQSDSQQQVILGLVLAIDVIIAAHTLLARSQHGTVMRVTKIGKAGSFARMACVTFLLLAEVGDDMVYRVAEIVGAMAGGAGVCLGLTALWQYQRQI